MSAYDNIHYRLKVTRGRAAEHRCIGCGGRATDWALQSLDNALADPLKNDQAYSENPDDYAPMCRSCHEKFDYSRGKNSGWKTAWANPSPEFLANNARAARENGVKARTALAEKLATPEGDYIREAQSQGARNGGGCSVRRKCSCGLVTLAAPLGRHQKLSGHEGYTNVQ